MERSPGTNLRECSARRGAEPMCRSTAGRRRCSGAAAAETGSISASARAARPAPAVDLGARLQPPLGATRQTRRRRCVWSCPRPALPATGIATGGAASHRGDHGQGAVRRGHGAFSPATVRRSTARPDPVHCRRLFRRRWARCPTISTFRLSDAPPPAVPDATASIPPGDESPPRIDNLGPLRDRRIEDAMRIEC